MAYRRSYGRKRSYARGGYRAVGRSRPTRRRASTGRSRRSGGDRIVKLVIETATPSAVSRPDVQKLGYVEKKTGRSKF